MAELEYEPVKPDESYSYKPKLPNFPVTAGIFLGYGYGLMGINYYGYTPMIAVRKFMIPGIAAGVTIGLSITYILESYRKRNQVFVETYRDNHPEDFVEPAVKKYRELILPWNPNR